MAKTTIQDIRQQLTDISRELDTRRTDPTLSEHDRNNLAYAADKVDAARQALFDCESQS
jgi:hypothetical protein